VGANALGNVCLQSIVVRPWLEYALVGWSEDGNIYYLQLRTIPQVRDSEVKSQRRRETDMVEFARRREQTQSELAREGSRRMEAITSIGLHAHIHEAGSPREGTLHLSAEENLWEVDHRA
jgi:hypothetical protein